MKKLFFFFIWILLTTLLSAQQNASFISIKTYEAGYDTPAKNQRVYNSIFDKKKAKYIWCEINLENLLFDKQDQQFKAKWIYFNPDGSEQGKVTSDWIIKKEWDKTWHQMGWGFKEAGEWLEGTYKIYFYLDDKFIAETSFSIRDYSFEVPAISFESIKLFEYEKEPPAIENRIYSTNFKSSDTRYIFYQLSVKNLLYGLSDNPVELIAIFYDPNGEVIGNPVLNDTLSSEWKISDLWTGWGDDNPGFWKPGIYKIEISYLGNLFASTYFTIN